MASTTGFVVEMTDEDFYAGDCNQCCEDVYRGIRTPHVCDPDYIREEAQ